MTQELVPFLVKIIKNNVKKNKESFQNERKEFFRSFKNQVVENSTLLSSKLETRFFVYGFFLDSANVTFIKNDRQNIFPGHRFLVIQYFNRKMEIRYRFFQSFVAKYTFQEALQKGNNDFSHDEIVDFLQKLETFISSKKWTQEIEGFYDRFFQVKMSNVEAKILGKIPLDIVWGEGCVEEFFKEKEKFDHFKENKNFPKFFLTKEGDSKTYKQALSILANSEQRTNSTSDVTCILDYPWKKMVRTLAYEQASTLFNLHPQ